MLDAIVAAAVDDAHRTGVVDERAHLSGPETQRGTHRLHSHCAVTLLEECEN